jgi:tetratricopeptide (TPR) repeat protein
MWSPKVILRGTIKDDFGGDGNMSTIVDLLSGEIERLFSTSEMKTLCSDYFDIDPAEAGIEDATKSVFARKIVDYCHREEAVEALADVVATLKRGMTDPRLQQIHGKGLAKEELKPGAKVDNVIIETFLDKDLLGQHYRCLGDEDELTYRLTVLDSRLAKDRMASQRFVALMRLLKAEKVFGIQEVIKAGLLKDGRAFAVSEWVDAPTLAERAPLTLNGALVLFESLLNALDPLHHKGIFHGDIKAKNVFVVGDYDDDIEVILEGFGPERFMEIGPAGMGLAPEQTRHNRADARSDIYALGALLYEALVGSPPFEGKLPVDVMARHLVEEVPAVSQKVDDPAVGAFDKFIAYLMAKDPGGRPRNIDQVRRRLEDVKRSIEQLQAQAANVGTREDIAFAVEQFVSAPTDQAALNRLLNDGEVANAWQAVVDVLEETAGTLEDPAATRRMLQLAADLSHRRLKNYMKALSIYEYLLSSDTTRSSEILNAVYELLQVSGRYEDLVQRLGEEVEQITEPTQRIELLRRMAYLYESRIKNPESAYTYYAACLTGTSSDRELLPTLERLAEKTGQFESLATSLGEAAQAAEAAGDAETTLYFYEKLGEYYDTKLDQPGYALSCYQKIMEFKPNDAETLNAVAEIYRKAQQWNELSQVLTQMAELETQPAIRRSHMVEAAELFYNRLSNSDQAFALLDVVIAEDPGNKRALDIMTVIIEATGDIQRLAKLLKESLDAIADDQEQIAVRCRLGKIYEIQLNDIEEAKRHYENALFTDAQAIEALRGLDRIYTKEGNAVSLRNNLDAQLDCPSVTPKQRLELLQRLADLCEEEFKEIDQAITYLQMVLDTDDTHRYALVTLTRLYRRQERWEELVDLLEKRAKLAADEEKKGLLKERAEIIKDKLKDAGRAIEALTEVTSLGVDEALETLAKTQEESGDYRAAIGTLMKIVEAAEDPAAKQALLTRIAMIEFDNLGDVDSAILTLRKARDLDPNDRPALALYGRVMIAKRNFAEALVAMEQEASIESGVSARAEILAQMGQVCMDYLDDSERAIAYSKSAITLDESNFTASFNLLKLYHQKGDTEKALPLYRRWRDAVDTIDTENRMIFLSNMGDTYAENKRMDEAYKAYARAISIEGVPVQPELLLKYAEAAFSTDQVSGVAEQIHVYLQAAQGTLRPDLQEALQVALAKGYLKQKNIVDANKQLRHLLSNSPNNIDARVLLADVQEERGDFRQMVESLMEVISVLGHDDIRRVEYMRRAAVVMHERLRDSDGAVKLLKRALETSGDDRTILAELLKIHTATKNFNELVEVILKIAEQVEDPSQQVRYYVSAAKVYRREIGNLKKAIHYFEKALDIDPSDKDANKAIVETLEQNMSWDKLEVHYKRLIAKTPKEAPKEEKLAIYKPLFELLAKKLKKKEDALVIGEAIAKLDPDDIAHAEVLSDMYGWDPAHADRSIALHRRLLEKNAARADSVRQLYRIFSAQGNPDRTWCAASVLSLLNACTPEELKYYKDYKPRDLQTFANVLDADQWTRKMLPYEMDKTITSIFSIVQDVIFRTKGQPLSRYGIDLSQAVDVTQSQYTASALVNFASGTLGIAPPPFFFLQGAAPGFQLLETNPPVLISDGNEEALTDRVATIFLLGQKLTLFYPGLFVSKMVTSGRDLLSWLLASIRMFAPQLPIPDDIAGLVSDKLPSLRNALDDYAMERLQGHVHTFISTSAAEVNLKKWAKTVTYTQDRAGLLLSGDLAVAVKQIREQESDDKRLADRLRAITLFALSTDHYELRTHLGSSLRSA